MTQETFDFKDGNGAVPARRHKNPDGTIGGWVAETATVSDSVYIGSEALVYGKAQVSGYSKIKGGVYKFGFTYSNVKR